MTRVVIVTNAPAPYRLPVYELLSEMPDITLSLIFCTRREADRHWKLPNLKVPHVFLREQTFNYKDRYIHANIDAWPQLRKFAPDVVVTTGFNPTHLVAFAYALLFGLKHVSMTDGTFASESNLTVVHRWVRRQVYSRTSAFIGASAGSSALYQAYGAPRQVIFTSRLCANNPVFTSPQLSRRNADLIFSGRFVAVKRPLFAIEVAAAIALRLQRPVTLLLIGSGELEAAMRLKLLEVASTVIAEFSGFLSQEELPRHYARARLLLFPTTYDPWGVVANEACAAGTPVLVSPHAGVAGELVIDGENGRILPLDINVWAEAASHILRNAIVWNAMSLNSLSAVKPYTYNSAAAGIAAAVAYTEDVRPPLAASAMSLARRRVVLVQRRMTHYRVPLFEQMRIMLEKCGIDLVVVHGDPTASEISKIDTGYLPWSLHVRCIYLFGDRLCLQWAWPVVRGADLVIVTQENKLLLNYFLQFAQTRVPMALWGHGRNFQSAQKNWRERFKLSLARRADWWFAYTQKTADIVRSAGFAGPRVTVLNNTIDTQALLADLHALADVSEASLRQTLGLGSGPVGLILSSIYAEKRLDFAFEAARHVHDQVPDFQLLVAGDGPDRANFESLTHGAKWVRYVGSRIGRDKAMCLRVARLMIAPFGVGLVVLDSFVAGVPLVVTDAPGHNPEFGYLRNGENCIVTEPDDIVYANAIVRLLRDEKLHSTLVAGGCGDAADLTLERMATRFCSGIVDALTKLNSRKSENQL